MLTGRIPRTSEEAPSKEPEAPVEEEVAQHEKPRDNADIELPQDESGNVG